MSEIKEITKEMRDALRAPLPKEAVKTHPTKTYLSSIKAIYVTERLNDVFGVGAWTLKTAHISTTDKGMVVCKTVLEIPSYGVYYESFGGSDNGGENSKNFDLGDAFKGATTDAITKIGSYLEIGIDVFKGLNTPPPAQRAAPGKEVKKLWLNPGDQNWKNAVGALAGRTFKKDGGKFLIKDIELKYQMTSKTKEQLLNEASL